MKYRNTTRYTCIEKKLRVRKMDNTQFLSQSEATDKIISEFLKNWNRYSSMDTPGVTINFSRKEHLELKKNTRVYIARGLVLR